MAESSYLKKKKRQITLQTTQIRRLMKWKGYRLQLRRASKKNEKGCYVSFAKGRPLRSLKLDYFFRLYEPKSLQSTDIILHHSTTDTSLRKYPAFFFKNFYKKESFTLHYE